MFSGRRPLFITMLVLLLILCVAALAFHSNQECERRDNIIPRIPIFPGATLVKTTDESMPGHSGQIFYEYEVLAPPQQIGDFYENCVSNFANNRLLDCSGKAEPFGAYHVWIEKTDNINNSTGFTAWVYWDKCSSRWVKRIGEWK